MKNDTDTLFKQNKQYIILLERKLKNLNEANEKANNENKQLNATINTLKNNNQQLNNTITNLNNKQNELIKNYSLLKNNDKNLFKKNGDIDGEFFEGQTNKIINDLKNEIYSLKFKNNELLNEQRVTNLKLKEMEKNNILLKKSNENYEKKINEFEKSKSWKITNPLKKNK